MVESGGSASVRPKVRPCNKYAMSSIGGHGFELEGGSREVLSGGPWESLRGGYFQDL